MSELNLPICPICHAEDSLFRQTMEREGQPFVWYECQCGSVLLRVGDAQWSYQKIARKDKEHLLKRTMTVEDLHRMAQAAEAPATAQGSPSIIMQDKAKSRAEADLVTLTCPSCGGKLQITNDINRFACAYCGTEHVVRRSGGLVSLAPVVEGIQQVRMGVDKTASELAIHRLEKEIPELVQQRHKMASQISSAAIFGVILTVLIFFVGLFGATVVNERLAQGIYVGTVILAIVILVRASTMSTRERENRCAPIDEKIAGKTAELKRHQRIVSQ